ncbi:spermidine/putrescine import ATP-binding protein PotA [Variibacter gotjawalensis]|uniref:Spermidine/putrescine import ATP-binding protein PotA n=1 Tax=Variibacter gotjawalensis TaxID=1333996 RepID=A0A0S3Q047_9BRAD|nr:ABC transporter ATP-binding protein [Variibacter gotjawalensis]NIK47404.1 iron(III) transport system ATP-binding protein [Variibacter gotjawalensis]RZS49300.1 iron(III) transport system ATP-binding protein [Variibacter gotjawalensis]BAT61564.1 spermidine/putrescine import ATP-binding protein PotA [Variibacter gotjawalensis]
MSEELKVERLRKVFSVGRPAIDDVSFKVAAGEIVVLLGPSGCGKTTTLRCVAGLEHPTEGIISIGKDVVSAPERGILMPPRHRNIGMVFQSYAVWPHMTVRQNVAFPLKHRKTPRGETNKKVDEALAIVGLSEYSERPVVALSGGQMQRVALARSLVYQPRLLLLDEPLSNLDAKLRLRLRDDLRRIIKQTNVTAIYVTHDQAEAVVLGDRIGVMRDGKMLQLASPQDIYNTPADLFVANFTGASNQIDGKVIERSGNEGLVETKSGERLRATLPAALQTGSPVKIALRPEAIRLGGGGDTNIFTAKVADCRYHGTQTVYDLAVFGGKLEALELGTEVRYPVGSEVKIALPPSLLWGYAANETSGSEH